MTKRAAAVVGVVVFVAVAFVVGKQLSLVTQIVEVDGRRTTEYGAFGSSFPLKNEKVPDLQVSEDVVAHIGAAAPPPSGLRLEERRMAVRIVRPENTEWTIGCIYRGTLKSLEDHYRKHLTGFRTIKGGSTIGLEGKGRDGSDVSMWLNPTSVKNEYEVGMKVVSRH